MPSEPALPLLRVELDLVADSEPIRGHLRDPSGERHGFHGWLELIELLRRAGNTSPGRSPEP
ncbi:hypothetical protein NLX83_30960 [Allokutzneria sp. A3M-2-11 16]|uniref:hypothetical protein n=1 Tax=Allokutzneria sp. A3M-2-11 16 TaxID=2962043 RepID=UPI0020B8B3CB|nr:hypothetical protein [Allokutzneria sp. A3M-2-11 16]MCP3803701.1 hypothetical protein [Allokutzneria sp. A3M-2-11 16]